MEWQPITNIPERFKDLILALSNGSVVVGCYYGASMGWDWAETELDEDADASVTHWMSFPEAPK